MLSLPQRELLSGSSTRDLQSCQRRASCRHGNFSAGDACRACASSQIAARLVSRTRPATTGTGQRNRESSENTSDRHDAGRKEGGKARHDARVERVAVCVYEYRLDGESCIGYSHRVMAVTIEVCRLVQSSSTVCTRDPVTWRSPVDQGAARNRW